MAERNSSETASSSAVSIETGRRHTFILKREYINIRILDRRDHPIAGTRCRIEYDDGTKTEATTDERGWVKVVISEKAGYADFTLDGVTEDARRRIHLIPPDKKDQEGGTIQQKLWNLGFPVEPDPQQGILAFQEAYDLELSGQSDSAFKQKLEQVYAEFRDRDKNEEDEDAAPMDDGDGDIDENEGRT